MPYIYGYSTTQKQNRIVEIPTNAKPEIVGEIAEREGITNWNYTEDYKTALDRLISKQTGDGNPLKPS